MAYRLEFIDADVGVSRRLEFPKDQRKEVQVFSLEEVDTILEKVEEEPIRIRAIIETALFTGCHRGEIVGLKWADIDLINHKLTVRRSIYNHKGEKATEKAPKTRNSYRTSHSIFAKRSRNTNSGRTDTKCSSETNGKTLITFLQKKMV